MNRILPVLLLLLLLTGCGGNHADGFYQQISQEEAKEMMDTQEIIVLDVREQDEYDSSHISGAVLLPVGTIDEVSCWTELMTGTSIIRAMKITGQRKNS